MNSTLLPRSLATLLCLTFCTAVSLGQNYGYPQQASPPPQYRQPAQGYPQYPQQSYPQQGYPQQGYPQPGQTQYVSPAQFLPTFGRKFGEMFRRVFYGDTPPAGYSQPSPQYQQPQYQQPSGRLDQPPSGYNQRPAAPPQYQTPVQPGYPPRYEAPPAPRGTIPAMPPTSRTNSGSSNSPSTTKKSSAQNSKKSSNSSTPNSSKYTPPAITREPSQSRFEEQPPPPMQGSGTIQDAPPSKLPGSKPSVSQNGPSTEKPNAAASSGSFLRGKKTGKEGRVISPYPPYRELDVSGLSSGSLALDPTTQKVFEVP